eukprot:6484094-Amphidinium_carterae.1
MHKTFLSQSGLQFQPSDGVDALFLQGPRDTPPAHMDMPPPEQLAEFHGSIYLCHTKQMVEHPAVQEQGSRASDDARRAMLQREKEEWAVNHQDRFQPSQGSSEREGRPERAQSYTPYTSSRWEHGSHGHWDRKTWQERGWRHHPDYQTRR